MATRTIPRGAETRARILAAAARLLTADSAGSPTVGAVADAADVYPNQITHHFGSKDRLLVDAAFTLFLRDTARLQTAGRRATSPDAFRSVLARTALLMPSTPVVVSCLALQQSSPEVQHRVQQLVGLLFRRSERYLGQVLDHHGWTSDAGAERDARTFWSAVFGAALFARAGVPGGPSDLDLAATLTIRPGSGGSRS